MSERGSSRPVSTTQVISILASTLALFFMVAFAAKSLEVHRLKYRRDQLEAARAALEWERQELEEELRHRQFTAWVEESLRDAGQAREGERRVTVETATPRSDGNPTPRVVVTATPPTPSSVRFFGNPNWDAWRDLIWGSGPIR